jgi:hypothetical protein
MRCAVHSDYFNSFRLGIGKCSENDGGYYDRLGDLTELVIKGLCRWTFVLIEYGTETSDADCTEHSETQGT